jgi:hypothetical protein
VSPIDVCDLPLKPGDLRHHLLHAPLNLVKEGIDLFDVIPEAHACGGEHHRPHLTRSDWSAMGTS